MNFISDANLQNSPSASKSTEEDAITTETKTETRLY